MLGLGVTQQGSRMKSMSNPVTIAELSLSDSKGMT